MKDRDYIIIKKIIQYSCEINYTIKRFKLNFNKFENDSVMINAISMCLLQIGELVRNLTDEFKDKYNEMPWYNIIGLRNKVAHAYSSIDKEIVWYIASNNIPELKYYCEEILYQNET